jgi:hypothetical protein
MVCEIVWIFRMNVDLITLEMIPLTITYFTTSLSFNEVLTTSVGARGGVVVKALCYKPAGRGFDSRWRHWNF